MIRAAAAAVRTLRLIRTASNTVNTVLATRTADTMLAGAAVWDTTQSGMIRVSSIPCSDSTADAVLTARKGRSRNAGPIRPRRGAGRAGGGVAGSRMMSAAEIA